MCAQYTIEIFFAPARGGLGPLGPPSGYAYGYTMRKSMRKSKNCYFDHIFVSPGYAPLAITLNVVRMEREFDAYKLSRCMCPSNYNRFLDRAIYL